MLRTGGVTKVSLALTLDERWGALVRKGPELAASPLKQGPAPCAAWEFKTSREERRDAAAAAAVPHACLPVRTDAAQAPSRSCMPLA